MNYDNKRFRPLSNSENGEVDADMLFHYRQEGRILRCDYAGGRILAGQLIGLVDDAGHIEMRYQHINTDGQMMTGTCQSRPERLPDGRIRLHEHWRWTSGDGSEGYSLLEEI